MYIMALTELPLDLVSHIALWLPDAPTLARMQWASKLCRQACQQHAEKMRRLLKHSARMAKLLRCAEYHSPRPLDYEALLRQQQADETREFHVSSYCRASSLVLPTDLMLSAEILYGESSWAWCGPPEGLLPQLNESMTVPARVWEERPAFIDELNRLNKVNPGEANKAWSKLRLRAFMTRGLRIIKLHEGAISYGKGSKSYTALKGVGRVFFAGEQPIHGLHCDIDGWIADDGVVGVRVNASYDEWGTHMHDVSALEVRELIIAASAPLLE